MLSEQEIFDKVSLHLLTQNKKSRGPAIEGSYYHGINGLTCAIGCLIPDEYYDPAMEGISIWWLLSGHFETQMNKCGLDISEHLTLLKELQLIHDYTPIHLWCNYLKSIATKLKLSPQVCNSFEDQG